MEVQNPPVAAMVLIAVLIVCASALVVAITWAAATGLLRRNDIAGIRTKRTMSSEEKWRLAHARALGWTTVGACAASAAVLLAPLLPGWWLVADLLVAPILLLAGTVVGAVRGWRAAA